MDYVEFYSWSQRWFMENFPPLPLVKYESPCYDPYEIDPDPSHYPDPYNFSNLDEYDFNNQSFNNQNYTENYSYYESESSESDLEDDTP